MAEQLSGRELDAEVHVRVMGFPLESRLVGDGLSMATALRCEPENAAWRVRSDADMYWNRLSPDGAERVVIAPNYSESIEAAMEVVDKMREFGWRTVMSDHDIEPTWSVEMFQFSENHRVIRREVTESNVLAEAICHAALAAIGGQKTK